MLILDSKERSVYVEGDLLDVTTEFAALTTLLFYDLGRHSGKDPKDLFLSTAMAILTTFSDKEGMETIKRTQENATEVRINPEIFGGQ